MKYFLLIIAMLLVFPASVSGINKTNDIDMTLSGTVLHVSDVRTFYDVNLKGSPGSANARGAGRFEDATGYIVIDLVTNRIQPGSLVTPETGVACGEIILPRTCH